MIANKRHGRLQKKLSDYQRIVMLISQNKIAGVSRILSVALRNGADAESICVKLHRAIDGTYSPLSGWTSHEFDVAFLIKAIGGPRLLYALQKAEGYPSLSTLRKQKPFPEVAVSVKVPTNHEISANMAALLGEGGRMPPKFPKVGQVIVIDGAAIEQAIRFDFKRNHILGLCREHSTGVKTLIEDVQDLHNVGDALFNSKTCHRGKDATVLGLAPVTDTENYHVTPLILSSSCKSETGEELASWVRKVIEDYRQHSDGERRHGPICTLATDGESSFRKLRFILCLTETLDPNSDLSRKLSVLPGLNLQTGPHGILGTCDPKHIVKRFATMLRSPKGFTLGLHKIESGDVLKALCHVPMSEKNALLLLNPTDKQNVPKAVNLINDLFKLYGQNLLGMGPGEESRMKAVAFVAKVFSYFLFPFTKVEMSLSEQLRSLSTYSHLITAIYLRQGLAFMSSALFADSQAIVKNIIFTIARLQLTVPSSFPYYILFEGTDRLENIFSHVRTQDHARNFDIQQLSHKLSIAAEIDAIFQRNPDLNQGHIRRNLINARGIDHMNPKSWIGNTCVGEVDIRKEYLAGRSTANDMLSAYFQSRDSVIDFDRLFSKPGVDHLRPKKEYIGSRTMDLDGEVVVDDLEDELPVTGQLLKSTDMETQDNEFEDTRNAIDIDEYNGTDVDPEDVSNSNSEPHSTHKKSDEHYLTVNGQKHYIPTLISMMLDGDREETKIETSRLSRVQGITRERGLNSSGDQLDTTEGKVKSGDLGAVLTRVGDQICLAVVEALNFRQGNSNTNRAMVNVDDLDADGAKATSVAVQFLQLVSQEPGSQADSTHLTWWWPEQYIQIQDNRDGPILPRHVATRISGKIFHLLSPNIIYNSVGHPIWSLHHSDLERALKHAWEDLDPDSDNFVQAVKSLPEISGPSSEKIPYRLLEDGSPTLYIPSSDIPVALNTVKLAGKERRPCHFCGETFRISEMRNHVGAHILKAQRGVDDFSLIVGKEVSSFKSYTTMTLISFYRLA